jgi:hypothetical protein
LVALPAGAAFFGAAVFWGGAIGNSHVGDGRRRSCQRAGERRIVGRNTAP